MVKLIIIALEIADMSHPEYCIAERDRFKYIHDKEYESVPEACIQIKRSVCHIDAAEIAVEYSANIIIHPVW